MPKKQLASEALIDLHRRLSVLPSRSHERRLIVQETAHLIWSIRTNALSGVGAKGTAQGVAALRPWYTAGSAARQDGVLLRTHRRH